MNLLLGLLALLSSTISWASPPPPQLPNLIINGGFLINQRASSYAAVANNAYTIDRWKYKTATTTGVVTIGQSTAPVTSIPKALKVTVTTADAAVAAGDLARVQYPMIGYDLVQLAGKTATLSFWVSSPKTGAHCVAFNNSAANRNLVRQYTVTAANTWEKKSITFTHVTTGTWNYNQSLGMTIDFPLIIGATFAAATDNTWGTSEQYGTSSCAANNILDSTSNTFFLSGVMLTVGSQAAPFTYYGGSAVLDINAAKSYYQTSYDWTAGSYPAAAVAPGSVYAWSSTTTLDIPVYFQPMIGVPAITVYSPVTGTSSKCRDITGAADVTATERSAATGLQSGTLSLTSVTATRLHQCHFAASAEL